MSGTVFRHFSPSDKWDIARKEHADALTAARTNRGVFGPDRSGGGISWGSTNNKGICTFTICAHGSIALTEHTETREMASIDEGSFDTSVFSKKGVNLTVARVVDPSIFVPGLSLPGLSPEGKRDVPTNFTLHLPNITNKIREFMSTPRSAASAASASASAASASAIDEKLNALAREIMVLMREIDEASGIVYPKQETSNPGGLTTTEDHFYNVYKIDSANFIDALRRLLYIRPNIGEAVRPVSGLPKRESSDGSHPFSYYGIFIFTATEGLLPESCTLLKNHDTLISTDKVQLVVNSKQYTFQKYKIPEDVSKYNLADFENRLPIEIRIGVNMGYLNSDGSLSADDYAVERWQEFKHDPNGPIQTLRRAITNKLISHVGAALILSSLGYKNLLLVDTACNSIDVTQPPDPPVVDSQELLVSPIENTRLLFTGRPDIVIFDEAKELERQKALKQRRKKQKQFVEDLRRDDFLKQGTPGGSRKSMRSYSRKRRTRRKRCATRRYRRRRK